MRTAVAWRTRASQITVKAAPNSGQSAPWYSRTAQRLPGFRSGRAWPATGKLLLQRQRIAPAALAVRRTLADGPLPLQLPIFAEAVGLLDRTDQTLLALPVLRDAEPQYPRAEARIARSMLFHRLLNAMARAINPLQEEWIARRDAAGDDPEKQLAVADALWVLQQKYEA